MIEAQINPYGTLLKVSEDRMEEFLYGDWKPIFIKENHEPFLDQAERDDRVTIVNRPQLKLACACACACACVIKEIKKLRKELNNLITLTETIL